MGRRPDGAAQQELLALHSALVRARKEKRSIKETIPLPEWEGIMVATLSRSGTLLTRQACADKTWFLERLGLIKRLARKGVIVLDVQA